MAFSIRAKGVPEAAAVSSLLPEADEPVTWHANGEVLSRFGDSVWALPWVQNRPSSRQRVQWPTAYGDQVTEAKSLAVFRLTHGKAVGYQAAYRLVRVLSKLAERCGSEGVKISEISRYPNLIVDFAATHDIAALISLSRVAFSFREKLGWTFLESAQIEALRNIESISDNQHPVIPLRIRRNIDLVAEAVVLGYLRIADDYDSVCQESYRKKRTWKSIIAEYPDLLDELGKWNLQEAKRNTYISLVRASAFWIIAGGSCARKSEILSLKRGCFSQVIIDGRTANQLTSATTKTQKNSNAIWIVSKPVEKAVRALERTLDWYEKLRGGPNMRSDYLFQVFDYALGKVFPSAKKMGYKSIGEPVAKIEFDTLLSYADTKITEADFEEAKALTPTLDKRGFSVGTNWVPSPHQQRRTVLVHAAASGLISQDSLSFQAKHETWSMTSYYCRNYWLLRVKNPGDPLVAGVDYRDAVQFSQIYVDSYNRDRQRILNDDRFFSLYGEAHKAEVIDRTPLLSLKELMLGERGGVLSRTTLGICAETGSCEWKRAATVRGCLTKMNGKPCVKAIVDSDRVAELEAHINDLLFQLDNLRSTDVFAREQIEADIEADAGKSELK